MSRRDDPVPAAPRTPLGWDRAAAREPGMDHVLEPGLHTRLHVDRRGRAIDRLRGFTTGVAVAGVAGTAGFAILAAATWSGVPGARSVQDLPATERSGTGAGGASGGSSGSGGTSRQPVAPNGGLVDPNPAAGGSSGSQGVTRVRPAQPHTGHAATGGSG